MYTIDSYLCKVISYSQVAIIECITVCSDNLCTIVIATMFVEHYYLASQLYIEKEGAQY